MAKILFINPDEELLKIYSAAGWDTEVVSSVSLMDAVSGFFKPDLIFVTSVQAADIASIRKDSGLLKVPVIILAESFRELNNLNSVSEYPFVIVCNRCSACNEKFMARMEKLALKKEDCLSVKTSRCVKYAVLYMNKNVSRQLTRSMIASQLGINEDYLTKIFRKEMGVSLWDYFNEYRLFAARKMLEETGLSVAEISEECGFADDAYFNNVFRRYYKCSPGSLRKNTSR